jgi:hypothetical protein
MHLWAGKDSLQKDILKKLEILYKGFDLIYLSFKSPLLCLTEKDSVG